MDRIQREPDAVIGEFLIEIKVRPPAIRGFREALLALAYQLAARPGFRALLVLVEPGLSVPRLKHEWQLATTAFRPELFDRINLVTIAGDRIDGLPSDFTDAMRNELMDAVFAEQRAIAGGEQSRDSFTEILKVLVRLWLENSRPVTTVHLGSLTGFSYPTVSRVLKRLDGEISRSSDRRIELRDFPRDAWSQLVVLAESVRPAIRFADRSGQPYSPEALLGRFSSLAKDGAGIGGVVGARHHCPALDLVGIPRLDITIHSPAGVPNLSFIRKLDPALEITEDRNVPAALVVHLDRCPVPSFERASNGVLVANPVECLLDLHEAKLEPQALELLNTLITRKKGDT